MYSCGPLHIDEQRQDDQLEPTYNSSVPIRDETLRICRKQWTRGGERGSRISVLMALHDDNDDLLPNICLCVCVCVCLENVSTASKALDDSQLKNQIKYFRHGEYPFTYLVQWSYTWKAGHYQAPLTLWLRYNDFDIYGLSILSTQCMCVCVCLK